MDVRSSGRSVDLNLTPLYKGGIATNEEFWEKNGIPYDDTFMRYGDNAQYRTHAQWNDFFDSLSEQELDKNTLIQLDGKNMVGTYRQAREIILTKTALWEEAVALSKSIEDHNNDKDPRLKQLDALLRLVKAVSRNMDGAIELGKAYLKGLREPQDTITLSAEALTKLYGGAGETRKA